MKFILNFGLLSVVLGISIYQLMKVKRRRELNLFPFLVATSCLVLGEFPETYLGEILSIITCGLYLIYLLCLGLGLPIKMSQNKMK